MEHPFDRYAAFTDLEALKKISSEPLRKSKRVNLLKTTVTDFVDWAKRQEWDIKPVPWCKEAFYVDRENRERALGRDLFHLLGFTYMQEAASMLPPELLDPQPGENILDMSAAPGSKTTQIASKMQEQGIIIANDMQEKRLWTLNANMQRSGVINAILTKKVGQWFSRHMTGRFDRVLIDAPCTAQGTLRKDSTALEYCSADNIGKMSRLQVELLEAAIHATKVGGRIVYSTCTLTPEENESVIETIMNKFGDQVTMLDPMPDILKQAKADSLLVQKNIGIKKTFPAYRLWPQTYDTEGFFCAVLQKNAPTRDADRMEMRDRFEREVRRIDQKKWRENLKDWYGTDFMRDQETLFESKKQMFLTTQGIAKFPLPMSDFALGLPFGKPTTHGLVRLSHETAILRGHMATAQVIDITEEQFAALLNGQNLKDIVVKGIDDGDVLLRTNVGTKTIIAGRGLLKDGELLNRLPREIVRVHG